MINKLNNTPCKINIAIIGCGRISKKHVMAIIGDYKRCELVALCDNNQEKLDIIYTFFKDHLLKNNFVFNGLKKFNSYQDLIKAHSNNEIILDLVVLATPSGLHPIQTKIAARSGINVCTEKPMALNLIDAEDMIKVCKSFNVKLFVVKQNRFNSTLQILKKFRY